MGQISMEISRPTGSVLNGIQHYVNPMAFPVTERVDHTDQSLRELAAGVDRLAQDLNIYLAVVHSHLMRLSAPNPFPEWADADLSLSNGEIDFGDQ